MFPGSTVVAERTQEMDPDCAEEEMMESDGFWNRDMGRVMRCEPV